MKQIENLRNKYKGKEIWILGTGSSIDDYPEDFFDDKISIAMKWCAVTFPNCTYYASDLLDPQIRKFLMMNPKLLKKHIFFTNKKDRSWLGKYTNDPIYIRTKRYKKIRPKKGVTLKDLKHIIFQTVDCIKRKESCKYPATGTCLHWVIQAAAILGAKKITCVGCEDKCSPVSRYAEKMRAYYLGNTFLGKFAVGKKELRKYLPPGGLSTRRIEELWNKKLFKLNRRVTRWLAVALKRNGVEVALYHYKDSEQYKAGYLKLA